MADIDAFNFKLTPSEKAQPGWNRLRQHLEFLLETARRKNDGPLNAEETARLRGRIECLKAILDFGTTPPPMGDGEGRSDTFV
jgi:hypothetical protein